MEISNNLEAPEENKLKCEKQSASWQTTHRKAISELNPLTADES